MTPTATANLQTADARTAPETATFMSGIAGHVPTTPPLPAAPRERRRARPAASSWAWVVVCAALGGCATDQWYESVRNAQRLQCQRLADELQRQRCLEGANLSRSNYQQQTAPYRSPAPEPQPTPVRPPAE